MKLIVLTHKKMPRLWDLPIRFFFYSVQSARIFSPGEKPEVVHSSTPGVEIDLRFSGPIGPYMGGHFQKKAPAFNVFGGKRVDVVQDGQALEV